MRKIFLILLLICLIISPTFGAIISNMSVVERSSTSIWWTWEGTTKNVSVDGIKVNYFDILSNNFSLTGIADNETHTFCAYSETNSVCNSTKADLTPKTSAEKIIDYTWLYIFFLLALICLIISAWIRLVASLAFLFSLLGIINSLGNTTFEMSIIFVTMTLISIASMGYDR